MRCTHWLVLLSLLAAACASNDPRPEPAPPAKPAAKAPVKKQDLLVSAPGDYDVDRHMGEYPGTFSPTGGTSVNAVAHVIARGPGVYQAVVRVPQVGAPLAFVLTGIATDRGVVLKGEAASGSVFRRRLQVDVKGETPGTFVGRFVERKSKTLGAEPPPGAIVLLPFIAGARPMLDAWTNQTWKPLADGSMEVGKGSIKTKRQFGDMKLHLEFRIPYEPQKLGQGRGNSGVYLMDRYEVQVLDSFGLESKSNDCGGIYKVASPLVNACLPPLRWQTYDITLRAARLAADGTVVEPPVVTVLHNGRLIHDGVVVPNATGGAGHKSHGAQGPIMLQDHRNKVRYRNIWVAETKG